MDIALYLSLFAGALFVLLKSSDYFVESAEKIGLSFGISPFIIGVTIVACGTSLPELATGIASTLSGNSEIVGGTVIGSNITNILLVLGITVVVARKVVITRDIMNLDMPLLIISALFFMFTLSDGVFSLAEGFFFIAALVVFIISTFSGDDDEEAGALRPKRVPRDFVILIIAGALVSLGATYTVVAIEKLSEIGGVPKEVISLSILALGTSLPEVVVSVAAVRKGKQAIAVGNVLGSNLFNTYAVVGISRLFGDLSFSKEIISVSVPFMVAVTIIFAIICLTKRISRWEGVMLLLLYIYYMYTLIS